MAKPVKNEWIGARATGEQTARVKAYVEAAKTTMGDLVRTAVEEYIKNHPVQVKEQ